MHAPNGSCNITEQKNCLKSAHVHVEQTINLVINSVELVFLAHVSVSALFVEKSPSNVLALNSLVAIICQTIENIASRLLHQQFE